MTPPTAPAAPIVSEFLERFAARHGRAPRILHIGNIANNAYLNAKFLNRAGYDCDVLCYDYYHLMGCPEWEDADFDGDIADHFRPDWTTVDLKGFVRPRWFVQGPQHLCLEYLLARRSGQRDLANRLWRDLAYSNNTQSASGSKLGTVPNWLRVGWQSMLASVRIHFGSVVHRPDAAAVVWTKLERWATGRRWPRYLAIALAAPFAVSAVCLVKLFVSIGNPNLSARIWAVFGRWAAFRGHTGAFAASSLIVALVMPLGLLMRLLTWPARALLSSPSSKIVIPQIDPVAAASEWPSQFALEFPERPDQLTTADYLQYMSGLPKWRAVMAQYDIIQAYATDVAYPLLAGKRPYIGFEHGTLRDFTLSDNAVSRITALGYQQADQVFITNGDCLQYAQKIKVANYTPMVHPVDDGRIRAVSGDYEGLHRRYAAKYVFVCPLRHDWKVKGVDQYIRALPLIVDRIGRNFRVVMTEWGMQVGESQQLARDLGVADLIEWGHPLNRGRLVQLQKSADVVFDQIALPHFGATAPQAIAAGVPVIMSYDPASTAWIIPEAAPILSAWDPPAIAAAVQIALDPTWLANYKIRARQWFDRYHSSSQVLVKSTATYADVCEKQGLL